MRSSVFSLHPLSAYSRHAEDESRMNATRKAFRRVQTVAVPPRYGQCWLELARHQLVPPGLRTTDTAAPPARSFPGRPMMGKRRACSAGLLHDRLQGSHLLWLVSAGYAPTASTPDDLMLQPLTPALPSRLLPHDKPYRYRLAQRQAAAQPITPHPEATVIALVTGGEQRALTTGDQLLADEQHPHKRQQHRQHHPLHPLAVLKLGLLKVEAGALEVAKGRLDPVALATATPGSAVGGLVEYDTARRILLADPIDHQVDWAELVFLGQPDLLVVDTLAPLNGNVAQLLPHSVLVTEPGVALHANLPVPALGLTPALNVDGAKLGIAEEGDTDLLGAGQHRRQVTQQLNLNVGSRTTIGQQPAAQGDDSMVGGDDDPLLTTIKELMERHPRYGYRRISAFMRREERVNQKRIQRLRRKHRLQVQRVRWRHLRSKPPPSLVAAYPGHIWAYDFVEDALADGIPLRLAVMDEFTLGPGVGRRYVRLDQARARRALALIAQHGAPEHLRSDNGPEFVATVVHLFNIAWYEAKETNIST